MIDIIQPNDDLLGHQTSRPMSQPAEADRGGAIFTERFWYMGTTVPDGAIVFGAGLGYYPNRGIMDGYAGITVEGVQYCFRASRHTNLAPLSTEIGALRISVNEGLKDHRIELGQNESGLSMDLNYQACLPPNDEGRDILERPEGIVSDVSRFVQFGRYDGWIKFRDRRWEFNAAQCWGARDRSWGLRLEARTDESHPPVTRFRALFFGWVCAQFGDRGIHFFLKETAPGKPRFFVGNETYANGKAARAIIAVEHELEWFDDHFSQHLKAGRLTLRFADGNQTVLKIRALPGRFYLKAGLYGGLDGWFQGDDRGQLHSAHDIWSHADVKTRRKLRTLAEQVVEFDDNGDIGYGTIQAGVSAGYPKYQEIQHLPAM